ncbi:MAG: isoprenylcysteine carboxylmethyltransferase family protein [Burkholderiaceae bacterium]
MRLSSGTLVGLQFALLAVILASTAPSAIARGWVFALPLFALGTVLGLWALGYNKIGNFNIRPEVRDGAELVTRGPYRRLRHPMYTALLLMAAGLVAIDPRLARMALFGALFLVLDTKARREEVLLTARFPQYLAYKTKAARFFPGIY